MRKFCIASAIVAALAAPAQAGTRFPVIADAQVRAACSDCHMAYFPQLLPRASWEKVMGDLENHFGEDASLDPAELERVLAYYSAHASDVSGGRAARRWGRHISPDETPLRITDLKRFKRKHSELGWFTKRPKSMANCVSCHGKAAERGYFEDD